MMNWAPVISFSSAQGSNFLVGPFKAAYVTLNFDTTACGPSGSTVAGQTYDPTNYYTTSPAWSNVPGSNLMDVCGFQNIFQAICLDMSSSANAKLSGAATFTGTLKIVWDDTKQAFKLFLVGNSTTTAGADPTVRTDETELDGTAATAMAGLNFRMLLIGR